MKKLTVSAFLICACLGFAFTGCKKKEEAPKDTETEQLVEEESERETEDAAKRLKGRNLLTGEPMDEKTAAKRPLAIMIGNTVDALPQYGTAPADVLYEVPVEGGITRLMGIYQDYSDIERIGSVRSCRHYFAYYAVEFDAIYMHYGQAIYAEPLLASGLVDDLNGLDGKIDSLAFTRDSSRKAPHNAFTSTEGIDAAIAYREHRTEYEDTFTGHYQFAADGESVDLADGADAVVVQPGYPLNKPWFVYDDEEGLYYRFQFKDKHIDANNNEQLKFKNIIFQYSDYSVLDAAKGYLDVSASGTGDGKFITNGKCIDITWKKEDDNAPARYYDADGNEITLNQGKTCVCIVLNDAVKRVGVYATEAEFEEAKAAN